ncbi:two-component system response regulator [Sulfuricurvum sp.]|uniref:two-component system response regulator n=1 Tax=Sulfuricurvum sp. TaxID=2025608 RepID=UPI002E32F872|nr:EAL domain-containing protein [Sulfuricurvum sp.]HEX5330948.1 EAL domain-containing protein [Sulfuricurvum sp.]
MKTIKTHEAKGHTENLNVLYVEDEYDIRKKMLKILEMLYANVYVAVDGVDGLQTYHQNRDTIDLVIADITMPNMDGLEMIEEIRLHDPDIHAIIVTAHNEPEYIIKAINTGIDNFVVKPIEMQQLMSVLAKSAKTVRMRKENKTYASHLEKMLEQKKVQLEHSYMYDSLTGCLKKEKLDYNVKNSPLHTLILCNIDNFDSINSTYGYEIGDRLLYLFAEYLRHHIQEGETLYRVASDEFVILSPMSAIEDTIRPIELLYQRIQSYYFNIEDISINLTCTCGIASSPNALVKAHAAMKEARAIGKNRYHVFQEDSDYITRQKNNIEWMRKIRIALNEKRIVPYFQPIIDNQTLQIVKYEALARIIEDDTAITPYYFLEPAKLVGLLPSITRTMLEQCFAIFTDTNTSFSVNITEEDLQNSDLPSMLGDLTQRYAIDPSRVTLEILENISVNGTNESISQLRELSRMGYTIAIDDFGSDKSNFYRIHSMQVDMIKIDGAYIQDIDSNMTSELIVHSIVSLAQAMGIPTVAEYVSSESIYNKIKKMGVNYSQGFYFGEPMPMEISKGRMQN